MEKEEGGKEKILAAIRRAATELGRAPSRGELRRITGVSHYRVLAEFRTLREAVRAAGLEPNPKGEKISTEDLLADWKRVAEKLGRRPSRAEYVREGRYSAGALTVRFGSWSGIGNTYHGDTETRRRKRSGDSMKGEVKRKFSPTTGGGGFTRHPAPRLTFSEEGFSAVTLAMLMRAATTSQVSFNVSQAELRLSVNHDSIGDFWTSQAYSFVGLSEGA